MIKLRNINKFYNTSSSKFHALHDITLDLPDQGMVYVVGRSGSGKSTLLNIIGGIDTYDSGELIIENNIIGADKQIIDTKNFSRKDYNAYRNTYIGFIFQEFNVIKGLTVYENVALSLELQKKDSRKYSDEIKAIIEKVGLSGKENRRINQLSGGERQRVAIARALIKDPKVIIADEPTGNLDGKNRDIVMNILKELSKEKLILIVTHDKYLSDRYGDREITIKDGHIINDVILHKENLSEVVPTNHAIEAISPKMIVPLRLAWKGFLVNKTRFIIISLLFLISLVFAGTVFNLYLTNTTKEYSIYQKDYGNYCISLSNRYTYQGITRTTAFYNFNLEDLNKEFVLEDGSTMQTFTSMKINENINPTNMEIDEETFYKENIEYITIFKSNDELESNFKVRDYGHTIDPAMPCYITDYLAWSLIYFNYYDDTSLQIPDLIGKKLKITGNLYNFTIVGIIDTNYRDFTSNVDFYKDIKLQAAFTDNLIMYNSIYVSSTVYSNYFASSRVNYFYDDIILNTSGKITTYDHVKFTTTSPSTSVLSGNLPRKPIQGEVNQVAVSKGFLEKFMGINVSSANFIAGDNTGLSLGGGVQTNFYLCGTNRVPMQLEFKITGIIDDEDVVLYAPSLSEYSLYNGMVNSTYSAGGFLTVKISDDENENSEIYRNLLDKSISIDNPSFIKLQLVDNFIKDNIYLFAALFFIFCLFSILMIFNFVVINIKNSTRDIGIYMSLGMNGFKIAMIYMFQVLFISTIAVILGIVGETIFLHVMDASFSRQALIDFKILKNTFIGIIGVIGLGYVTPFIAIISPLISLSRKKPVDVIKQS